MNEHPEHIPVLLSQVVQVFDGVCLLAFFDGTVGFGGHAKALLQAHPEMRRYLACDRDPLALQLASTNLAEFSDRIEWIHGPYADMPTYLKERNVLALDGCLFDVGISSMQVDDRQRGFSFLGDAPLDMRMDPSGDLTAEIIVNQYPEQELARIFFEYGEERKSRRVARAVVEARKKRKIRTTGDLVSIIKPVATKGRLHPATLVFQALRIVVNDELGQLQRGLQAAMQCVRPGGRIAVISFHSLEDRIVKHTFRDAKDQFIPLTKKPICAAVEEIRVNPRARSAKLRAVEKKGNDL